MDNPFGQRYSKCRIEFSSKLGNYFNKYGELVSSEVDKEVESNEVDICRTDHSEVNNIRKPLTQSSSEHVGSFEKKCFVCQEIRPCARGLPGIWSTS